MQTLSCKTQMFYETTFIYCCAENCMIYYILRVHICAHSLKFDRKGDRAPCLNCFIALQEEDFTSAW